jgi:hypothetical protein
MPTEPQTPGPDQLEPSHPVEVPQPDVPIGVPAPRPDTIAPDEPQGIPPGSPQEDPQRSVP